MLHSSVCPIPRFAAGRPDQNSETAKKEYGPGQQRLDLQSVNKAADDRDEEEGGEGKPRVGEEHREQFFENVADNAHCSASIAGRRNTDAVTSPIARNRAAKTAKARSWPGQAMPSPSPVQNTPKADSIVPTPNFRVFSGTFASGLWMAMPIARMTTHAANAPRLAGHNRPRPEPTAMTIKTTSSPSSSTALKAVRPATQWSDLRSRPAVVASWAASEAKIASSSCSGITPAARRIALRSHPIPKTSRRMPITSWRR